MKRQPVTEADQRAASAATLIEMALLDASERGCRPEEVSAAALGAAVELLRAQMDRKKAAIILERAAACVRAGVL